MRGCSSRRRQVLAAATAGIFLASCAAGSGADEATDNPAADVPEAQLDNPAPINAGLSRAEITHLLADPNYRRVPGFWLHNDCVHGVPDGAVLQRNSDNEIEVQDSEGRWISSVRQCEHPAVALRGQRDSEPMLPAINGWTANSSATALPNNGRSWFSKIVSGWVVPPLAIGLFGRYGTVYLFNSLQAFYSGTGEIIQPVLGFGNTPAADESHWTIASYYVIGSGSSATAFFSTAKNAAVGATITGRVSRVNGSCTNAGICRWTIETIQESPAQTTTLSVNTAAHAFTRADQAVLEAYDIAGCDEFPSWPNPGSIFFQTNVLQPSSTGDPNGWKSVYSSLNWSANVFSVSPNCNFAVTKFADGASISWNN